MGGIFAALVSRRAGRPGAGRVRPQQPHDRRQRDGACDNHRDAGRLCALEAKFHMAGRIALSFAGDSGDRDRGFAAGVLSMGLPVFALEARHAHRDSGACRVFGGVGGGRDGAVANLRSGAGGSGPRSRRRRIRRLPPRHAALSRAGGRGGGDARLHRLHRRLCHHQPGGGNRFADAADDDLRHGSPRSESDAERHLDHGGGGFGRDGVDFRAAEVVMNRRVFLLGAAAAAACGKTKPRLNVYNWSDYAAPDTIPNFERESGLRVRYGTYESAPEMLAKVMTGNSGWDVVFPAAEIVPPMIEMGLLQKLDHSRLPHLNVFEGIFRNPPWDPRLEYTIPYLDGTTGILYRRGIAPEPGSWADLWDARLRGKMTMLDDPPEVFAACLKRLGDSINSGDPDQLRAAARLALAQKPLLRAYLNAEVRDQVIAGDVWAAQAWAVTAGQAIAAAPDRLAYCLPREGFARYCDTAAILRESRRAEEAHRFLDYLLRPEVGASIAQAAQTATPNAAARRLLPAKVRENPVLYPGEEALARGEWFAAQTAASQKLRDRLWTQIKSA